MKIPSPQVLMRPALTNRDARNSLRIRSYAKCRVSLWHFHFGTHPLLSPPSISPSPFFSNLYGHTCRTATGQPLCNQFVTHSFHPHGGGTPSLFHRVPNETKQHELPNAKRFYQPAALTSHESPVTFPPGCRSLPQMLR